MRSRKPTILPRMAIGVGVLSALLASCASTPVPFEKVAVAKASLQRAEQAGAPQYAPVELQTARDKITQSDKAISDRDMLAASRLADQANIDAQLAEATATQLKSHKAAMDFDASMQALRQESMRTTPASPVQ